MFPRLLPMLCLGAALTVLAAPARAQNDQQFVVGAGLGSFTYATTDDLRGQTGSLEPYDTAAQGQVYVEWYGWDLFGLGLRQHRTGGFQHGGFSGEREIAIDSMLLTGHWVAWGAQSYARFGLMAGIGTTSYQVSIDLGGTTFGDSTTGTATLLGGYLDWGGEGFGARLGFHLLSTRLADLQAAEADGSGSGLYLDLRWAFP